MGLPNGDVPPQSGTTLYVVPGAEQVVPELDL